MLGSFKVIKKSGLTEYGTPKAFGWNVILNTGADYADQKHHDLGRAVSDGMIDSIFELGPVSAALTVALVGVSTPLVVLAALSGTGIMLTKFFNPHFVDQVKSNAHNFETGIGKTVSKINWKNIIKDEKYVQSII